MEPKYLGLVDNLKRWVVMLDGYDLDITISKEFDSFWYKQKLAELIMLLEMDNAGKVNYLETEYDEIHYQLTLDQYKLELLKASSSFRFPSSFSAVSLSLCRCSSPTKS